MKLTEKDIKLIRKKFYDMGTKDDLLALINMVKKLCYGEKAYLFLLKQLNYHYNPKANKSRYVEFTIKKKYGKERTISAPNNGLKEIQKCLNVILQAVYVPNASANGFVP